MTLKMPKAKKDCYGFHHAMYSQEGRSSSSEQLTHGEKDTDIVITTTELLRMIDNFGLDFATLDPEACDMPFGFGSGGGVIFGVTGGVTEAVLRRLTPDHSKETMREIAECGVRGDEGIKEFSVPYKGMEIKICV